MWRPIELSLPTVGMWARPDRCLPMLVNRARFRLGGVAAVSTERIDLTELAVLASRRGDVDARRLAPPGPQLPLTTGSPARRRSGPVQSVRGRHSASTNVPPWPNPLTLPDVPSRSRRPRGPRTSCRRSPIAGRR